MSSYVFPGYPVFLVLAADELGHPESAASAGQIAPLTSLANLCAQASRSEIEHVEGILAKAAEFRNQLAVALRAAELIVEDVEAGRRVGSIADPKPVTSSVSLPTPRTGRKGARTEREHQ